MAADKDLRLYGHQLQSPVLVAPARYVRIGLAQAVTGYTVKSIRRKIEDRVWLEGKVWRRAPDDCIVIDLAGYHQWVEGR